MKHFFISVALLFSIQSFSQKITMWFDAGLKVQYGAAGLYNAAIGNSKLYDHGIGNAFSYGGKIGVNFGYSGISIDVMRSKLTQKFEDKTTAGLITNPNIDWSALDVYVLFRNAKNLGYFEIGPKVSFINKVEDTFDGARADRSPDFNTNVFSGVIGFGANILGNDGRFSGILGLRFEYAFTDFVSSGGQTSSAPLRDPLVYADGYKSSNIAFAGVVFEFNWGIGGFGRAQCGARSKFIMF